MIRDVLRECWDLSWFATVALLITWLVSIMLAIIAVRGGA